MSKYEPLGWYLEMSKKKYVFLTFSEIEEILGFTLSDYLYKYSVAWVGTAEKSPTHVLKAVLFDHGYQVDTVDLQAKKVVFFRL